MGDTFLMEYYKLLKDVKQVKNLFLFQTKENEQLYQFINSKYLQYQYEYLMNPYLFIAKILRK